MPRFATVEAYRDSLPAAQRDLLGKLLPLIDAEFPGAGAVWHGHPVWSLGAKPGQSPVCFVKAYAGHVSFGFWQGQALTDPSGRLTAGAREMASVKLREVADLDSALFAGWLRQARELAGRP
ncbi:DUF1801 domain-containing protein [Amycolatopsis magusensis]|uniref:DUF1801 domain-containing protein n=1 Tax=Amycolatopsis magusensis TaxID=882444 RepID=UPI003C2F7316